MYTFDLIDDPWIPVIGPRGRQLASLRDCLLDAPTYAGLAVEAPLETVAVFRQVLLPVYLDALFHHEGCPPPCDGGKWAELWQRAGQPAGLDVWPSWAPSTVAGDRPLSAYLDRYRDRFQLFGDRPFAQVAELRTDTGQTKPVSVLIAAAASGNNVPLFSARTEANPPALTPAQAIRAALATHCFDSAAIKSGAAGDPQVKAGKTTGNPTGPLGAFGVVLPVGHTLAETLLLHVPVGGPFPAGDRPQWRADTAEQHGAATPTWQQRDPLGTLDLLTWQARRIRLLPETDPAGTPIVRQVVLTAGDRLRRTPQTDPHAAWRMSRTRREQVPVRHTVGQAAWQGMLPLLATAPDVADSSTPVLRQLRERQDEDYLGLDYPLRVLTVGVQYGNQSAVVEDVTVDQIPVPVAALSADSDAYQVLQAMVRQADELRQAANQLGDNLRLAAGGHKLPWDKGQRVGDRMVHEFTPIARRVLAVLQQHPDRADDAEAAWRAEARRIALATADAVLATAAPETFLGRADAGGRMQRASIAEARYRAAIRTSLGEPDPAAPSSGGSSR